MLDLLWVGKGVNLCSFYGLRPLTLKIARFHPAQAKYGVIPAMLLSRNPGFIFALYFCTLYFCTLWPAATNVVALHPHQTKRKPTAVPSWNSQPPRNIFKQRKGRHG
ncbi:hypothetical protein CXF78_16775, partial [Shewanella sp. 11B5]|uniref:hypothetical protein n=1 Tax=Shewanella sp. 11B5 TaxID=2058298 RepID=UPI000CB0AD9F